MVPNLTANLLLNAALVGAILGLVGAGLFILISSVLYHLAQERRSRQALQRCAAANDKSLVELLARSPGVLTKAQDALDHARSLWQPAEAPPKNLFPHRSR